MTRAKKAPPLPPLPSSVFSVHGPVPVILTDDPKILDPGDFGAWNAHDRIIYVRCGMHLSAQWLTLWHERTHCDLGDVDFAMADEALEIICNAVASSRVAELIASLTP